MTHRFLAAISIGIASSAVSCCFAQSNVQDAHKFSWQENCGWMNWRDAGTPAGQQGVVLNLNAGFMSGFIWMENAGWINMGNGAGPYANTNNTNFGVNLNPANGNLTGYAWGENVGWINFSGGAQATPANPARVNLVSHDLFGYAWGENVGWINLDDPTHYVAFDIGVTCDSIDFNNDTSFFDPQDIDAFLSVYSEGPCIPASATCNDIDFNNDGSLFDPCDIDAFLLVFSEGPCTVCGV